MSIIVVHGIHTHGEKGIDKLGEDLESLGHHVRYWEYPKRWAIGMYIKSKARKDGAALAHFMREGDDIVAHSNGALAWQNSIRAGAVWGQCYIFGGACTSDKFIYPPGALKEAHIIYNPEDWALRLGSWLPFHPFGKLGYRGYAGVKDTRFFNINGFCDSCGWLNHSHYFKGERRAKWVRYVNDTLFLTQ